MRRAIVGYAKQKCIQNDLKMKLKRDMQMMQNIYWSHAAELHANLLSNFKVRVRKQWNYFLRH